ncbi:MAG: MBL fold metallo-hydrolase [Candidatus Nanopelagicales bacterium]
MLVAGFPAGPWGTNCFVVAPGAGEECVVIDPGKDAVDGIDEIVREHRLRPVAVLLTHGHIDHVWSVVPVCDARGIPAYIHPDDRYRLGDPVGTLMDDTRAMLDQLTGGRFEFSEPDDVRAVADGEVLDLAGLGLRIAHAPGHTEGSVTFGTDATDELPPVLFSGDLLFAGSIGRTDLPGGDTEQMMASLARVVLPMADDTVVLPGHGPQTTIGQERRANPYLRQVAAGTPHADRPRTGL